MICWDIYAPGRVCLWKSGDNLWKVALSFYVALRDRTRVVKLGRRCPDPLSPLT